MVLESCAFMPWCTAWYFVKEIGIAKFSLRNGTFWFCKCEEWILMGFIWKMLWFYFIDNHGHSFRPFNPCGCTLFFFIFPSSQLRSVSLLLFLSPSNGFWVGIEGIEMKLATWSWKFFHFWIWNLAYACC